MKQFFIVALVLGGLLPVRAERGQPSGITVEAGAFDRHNTIVEFDLPGASGLALQDGDQRLPLQIDEDGKAWFILKELKRGQTKTFRLVSAKDNPAATVRAKRLSGEVKLSAYGKQVLTYRTTNNAFPPGRTDLEPIYHRDGYIHPVFSPSGLLVTDNYPPNHKHHHGIWFAWTHTEFEGRTPDFWNMGEGKGTVEFVALDRTWSGPVAAGFESRHREVDLTAPKPTTALNEKWTVRLYAVGANASNPYFLFDVDVTDTCATDEPLRLPQYRYGGIGVRGNRAWDGSTNMNVLTSEGSTDRSKGDANQTHGRWCHIGGLVDGQPTGIAILGHPDNFRAPQPLRIHPTMPYINFAPQQAGDMQIVPGRPYVARYRFVVSDGPPDGAELDRLWNDYAHPPAVQLHF